MRIIELCLSPDFGGLELYMQRCCVELSRSEQLIAVVADGGRLKERLALQEIRFESLKRGNRVAPLISAYRLAKLIDRENIDLIHLHWSKDMPLAALAKKLSKRKPRLVLTRHMQITRPKRDFYHNAIYGQIDQIIAVTRRVADDMRRYINPLYADRVSQLYLGVTSKERANECATTEQIREEFGISADTFLVGLFGRIKQYKGQHLLVDAIKNATHSGKDLSAIIVGQAMEPAYLDELKTAVKQLGLEDKIKFSDFVDDPQRLMRACDVVALTTVEETFGLVLIEAMREGICVIGSNRGGVPEIIEHDKTGLLFDSGDAESLTKGLLRLVNKPELKQSLAIAGKEFADQTFNEKHHFEALHGLLQDCIKEST